MTEKGLFAALQTVTCQLLESGCILRCVFKSIQLFQDILLTWLAGEAYLEAHVSGICKPDGEISLREVLFGLPNVCVFHLLAENILVDAICELTIIQLSHLDLLSCRVRDGLVVRGAGENVTNLELCLVPLLSEPIKLSVDVSKRLSATALEHILDILKDDALD